MNNPGLMPHLDPLHKYRLLIEQIPATTYIAALDDQSSTLYYSPQIEELTGFTVEEWTSDPGLWFQMVYPEDQERVSAELEQSRQVGKSFVCEYRLVTRGRGIVWVSDKSVVFKDEQGKPGFLVGVMENITAQKVAEANLRAEIAERERMSAALAWEMQENAAIADVSRQLLSRSAGDEVPHLILEHAKSITRSALGFVGYIDPETGFLISPTMSREIWDACQVPDKSIILRKFGGLWGWVLNNRQPLMTNDPGSDPRSGGTPAGHLSIHRFLSVPAMIDGELLGQIALANADHDYTERDLTLVERLASFYALAVQHQRTGEALYRNAQRLEQLTNHLELQVASRTAELRATNQRLVSELEERQRIEAALRASETRYRLLAENASDVIWTVDLQNNPTYVSPSVTRLLGFSVEEAMSMTAADIFSPASFEHALQAFQALVGAKISGADDAQDTYRADYDLVHKDGSLVPVEINFSFLYNERGFPTGVLAITRSISERRQAELKISRRNSELQALVMISQVSNQTLHLDELLHSTLQVVLQVLNFEAGGIYLVDPNGESLRLHTHQGISEEFLHSVQRLYIGNGSAGRAYAENRPVIMDINNYPTGQLTPAAREHAYRTTLSTPLTAGGKILGVLNLGSRQESPYLVEDIPYLEAIGRQLGQAIANAQLYELAQTEIHMRRQAEKAILDSEARYRLLAETSRDSIFVINRDDRVLYLNGTAAAQFNQSAEALVGKQRSTLFPPATRVQQDESLRLVFETGQVYSEEHRHQFGERQAWLSTTLAPLHIENGQVSAVMGVSRDITERMLAQEAINYQANLVACVTDAIIATDMKFVISAWNTAAERMYGWKVAEVLV